MEDQTVSSAAKVLVTTALDINAFITLSAQTTATMVLDILLASAIVCLNSLCLVAMVRGRLFTEANKFIFMGSLATTNVLLGTLIIAQSSVLSTDLIHGKETFQYYCYTDMVTVQIVATGQVYSTLLLTIDQYVQIEKPLLYPIYATRRHGLMALAASSLSGVLTVVILAVHWATNGTGCLYYYGMPYWIHIYLLVLVVLVPLGVIIAMHSRVLSIVRKQSKRIGTLQLEFSSNTVALTAVSTTGGEPSLVESRAEHRQGVEHTREVVRKVKGSRFLKLQWKSVITVSVMISLFVVCWVPLSVCGMMALFGNYAIPPGVLTGTLMLYRLNFLVTPLIFIVRLKEVRKEIKNMFNTCKCNHP